MRKVNTITEIIGHTPMVEYPVSNPNWQLFLKLEKCNPGQSMKDRMALSMVEEAERSGALKPGGTIIESSSGNTGTGLAMIAASKGYRFIAVVDLHAEQDVTIAAGLNKVTLNLAGKEFPFELDVHYKNGAPLIGNVRVESLSGTTLFDAPVTDVKQMLPDTECRRCWKWLNRLDDMGNRIRETSRAKFLNEKTARSEINIYFTKSPDRLSSQPCHLQAFQTATASLTYQC
jgi:hypothetical protein